MLTSILCSFYPGTQSWIIPTETYETEGKTKQLMKLSPVLASFSTFPAQIRIRWSTALQPADSKTQLCKDGLKLVLSVNMNKWLSVTLPVSWKKQVFIKQMGQVWSSFLSTAKLAALFWATQRLLGREAFRTPSTANLPDYWRQLFQATQLEKEPGALTSSSVLFSLCHAALQIECTVTCEESLAKCVPNTRVEIAVTVRNNLFYSL